MLDRESQKDDTIVNWSADGNSFIVTDPKKFEAVSLLFLLLTCSCSRNIPIMIFFIVTFRQDIYPAYFDSRIIFTTFLSKLYRWGFSRLSSKSGRYEFRSPTFSKFSNDSAPTTAVASDDDDDDDDDTSKNAGGSASIQHQTQGASPLQQVMEPTNQPSVPPNPLLPTQVDGIAALISNIQRSRQQSSVVSSQQSVLNSQLNVNHSLQPFQQWQHSNRTTDLLNTVLSVMAGSQAPSAQLMGYSSPSSQSSSLLSLLTTSSTSGTYPNTNTTPTIFQSDNNAIQSLLMLVHRVCEDERLRLTQVNATQNAIIATIGQLLGVSNTIDEAERRGLVAALGQALGSTGERTTPNPNVPLTTRHTGMNVGVPNAAASSGQVHQSIQQSSAGSLNFQVDRIAAILQASRRQDDDDNDEGTEDRPLPPRKRRSTDDGYGDDNRKKK